MALCLLVSCRPTAHRASASASGSALPPAGPDASASSAEHRRALPPLKAESWLITLSKPTKRPSLVSVPLGAVEPRPVVLGVHGAGDRPEWACGGYRGALDAYPFIVCPTGYASGNGKLSTAPPAELAADVEQALEALRERFGQYVFDGPVVYAGFSLGAIHAPFLLGSRGKLLPRVLLIEGGYREFTSELARQFAESGGQRVLLLCAAKNCGVYQPSASALRRAGIQTQVAPAGTYRHNLDAEMTQVIRHAWPWLVDGLPGWDRFPKATDAR